jgi:uncharacterized protein (TIGR03437 family)
MKLFIFLTPDQGLPNMKSNAFTRSMLRARAGFHSQRIAMFALLIVQTALLAAPVAPAASVLKPLTAATYSELVATVSGLAAGDFNNDGKGDLAVVWSSDSTQIVLTYIGNGDGTMQPGRELARSKLILTVYVADFNKDDKPDIAVISSEGIEVFLGKGDGTFAPPLVTGIPPSTATGSDPSTFLVADYNGDGIQDLIVTGGFRNYADFTNGQSYFYPGKGDGTFIAAVPTSLFPYAVADLNGDGIPDILGYLPVLQPGLAQNPPFVFLGKGHGMFDAGKPIPFIGLTGDFNGDGKLDMVAGALIALGSGDGTFKTPTSFDGSSGVSFVGDFNGDGKLDIFSGRGIITGNGDGTFNKPVFLYSPLVPCRSTPRLCSLYFESINFAVTTDLNGDGRPDIVYSFSSNYELQSRVLSFLNASPGDGILEAGVSAAGGNGFPAAGSIVSLFGLGLSSTTETAGGPPYPTTLGGIRLYVDHQPAQLFYVSPTQINYALPPSIFLFPTIDLQHIGEPLVAKGIAVPLVDDAPNFFMMDTSGLAAATAVRISPSGVQTPIPVFDCSSESCVAVPIDTSGDPVYLSVYGTGMNRLQIYPFCGSVGAVVYAGAQGEIPGMEQINIRLSPPSNPGTAVKRQFSCIEQFITGLPNNPTPNTSNTVYVVIK